MPMYNPPAGAAGIDLDALILKAKAKRAEQEKLKQDRLRIEGIQQEASQMPATIDPGRNRATVGGVEVDVSAPQEVNWAAPLARLGVAYAGKRAADKEAAAESEAQSAMTDAMSGGMGSDPEAARLMKLAQLGVPGAEQALAAKMQPEKKQPIAGLLQALPNLTPEAADALAAEYGMSPDQLRSMITGAQQQQRQQSAEEYRRQAALRMIGVQPRAPSEFELYQQNPELYAQFQAAKGAQRGGDFNIAAEMSRALEAGDMDKYNQLKDIAFASRGKEQSSGEVAYPLTPSQKGVQAKLLVELDKQMEGSDQFITDLSTARDIVGDKKNFTTSQKAAWAAANSSKEGFFGDAERVAGSSMLNPDLTVLNSIFMSKTLDDMAKLGGGDSNEELRTIRSSYPNAMQSQEAAQKLLNRLQQWEEKTRAKITAKRQDIQSGRYFSQAPEDIRTESYTPKDTAAPSTETTAPQIKIRSIR